MQDDKPSTQTTISLSLLLRRAGAVLICATLFVMFWGSFLVAEDDAYCCGHDGYVHQPWGALGYTAAVILGIPTGMLASRLWGGRR